MKRKLITQMCNEWRSNIWMSVELIIVGVVLSAIFGAFAMFVHMHKPPKGIDFSDIYVGWVGCLPSDANPYPDSLHNRFTDLEMLCVNLSSNPYVESIGTGINAIPYNYNYYGTSLVSQIGDSTLYYFGNRRRMDPGMIKTLRITGYNGESPDQLADIIENNRILISVPETDDPNFNPQNWVKREVYFGNDSTNLFEIGTTINGIRRVDFEPMNGGVIIDNIPERRLPDDVAVRVKPGKGREFIESLNSSYLEFGNVYISDMKSIDIIKEDAHRQFSTLMRNLTACTLFLMIAVFLGILGSFWYRTQQRIPEIAIRKVNGATDADILRRFLSEGLLILLVAAPFITLIIGVLLPMLNINEYVVTPLWLIWAMLPVTIAALALMIIAGTAFPAIKAMKVNPAEALKDQ